MRRRGRVSAAELAVVVHNVNEFHPKPEPPEELSDAEAAEWHAIVTRLPDDWFPREVHALLCTYCRMVVQERGLAAAIAAEVVGSKKYVTLMILHRRHASTLASLAIKLRLCQRDGLCADPRPSAHQRVKKPPTVASVSKPWVE